MSVTDDLDRAANGARDAILGWALTVGVGKELTEVPTRDVTSSVILMIHQPSNEMVDAALRKTPHLSREDVRAVIEAALRSIILPPMDS